MRCSYPSNAVDKVVNRLGQLRAAWNKKVYEAVLQFARLLILMLI